MRGREYQEYGNQDSQERYVTDWGEPWKWVLTGGLVLLLGLGMYFAPPGMSKKQLEARVASEQDAGNGSVQDAASVQEPESAQPADTVQQTTLAQVKTQKVTIKLSAAGDCTLGSDSRYNTLFVQKYNERGSAYFLEKVRDVFQNDDLTLVNFEGTLTTSTARADKRFTFKGDKTYTNILTSSSVEAVNIANNHTHDFGEQGFSDTKQALSDAGLTYSGYEKIAYMKIKGVKIAMMGFNVLQGTVTKEGVAEMIRTARSKGAAIVITSFHWGVEGAAASNDTQKALARAAIDSGSDLVLGHHPHVLQGIEQYKGKYIVYSLGNFCFGGNSNPRDKDTMIFQQKFVVDKEKKEVVRYGEKKLRPCSISGSSTRNDFQPRLLSGTEKNRVLEKIQSRS